MKAAVEDKIQLVTIFSIFISIWIISSLLNNSVEECKDRWLDYSVWGVVDKREILEGHHGQPVLILKDGTKAGDLISQNDQFWYDVKEGDTILKRVGDSTISIVKNSKEIIYYYYGCRDK